ncbi:MAG TPA: DUF6159 family protein [Burkholderiales bacterium]|nr:DUF6159 family protein [Burkholderiales bacterium]
MKRCHNCNSLMPDDAARCIRCGRDSAPASAAAATARPSTARVAPAATTRTQGGRLRNGWALAKQSARLLLLDKQLLVFPLLSGIACLLVLASFAVGALASGIGGGARSHGDAASWLLVFAYYCVSFFVIVYFNSALVACTMIRLRGGSPTVRDGLRAANERVAQIAAWALLAATVGTVLRMIEERVGFVGKIVILVLGATWALATFFVVPVLVVERIGPLDALKRSIAIIRQTWGESAVSNLSLGLIRLLVTLALVCGTAITAAVLAIQLGSLLVALAGATAVVLLLILSALVGSALGSITLTALYLYAVEGKVPQAFEGAGLDRAFASR